MVAILKKAAAWSIAVFLAFAILAICLLDTVSGPGNRSDASIQGGEVMIVVQGPKTALQDGNYADLVATEETFWYNASVPASSYSIDQIEFTWAIETELDTIVYVIGPTLKYRFYETGNYTINVSAKLPDDSTGWKIIDLRVTLDYDGDGIADAWERQWFMSTGLVDETTDHDGDGWTDKQEYENGTNPKVWTYKPGFFDEYWWLIVLVVAVLVIIVLYLGILRPRLEAKRKAEEQKKIAAAVEIEKTLLGLEEGEQKRNK